MGVIRVGAGFRSANRSVAGSASAVLWAEVAEQSSARADELRKQLDATHQSLCADLVERVATLESSRSD